jgi:hypothetical protein
MALGLPGSPGAMYWQVDVEYDEGNEPDLPQQPEELSELPMAHS